MFPGQMFSVSASFDSREKRYFLWVSLLFLALTASLPEGPAMPARHKPAGPFLIRFINHFNVPGGCVERRRDCHLIELQGENLHTGAKPRIILSGIGNLEVIRLDARGMKILAEIPQGVPDGPHTIQIVNSLGENEMIWTLKPR